MNEQAQRLFVYGTLMPGGSNHNQIEDYVQVAKPGAVEGILVDLGAFPALIAGAGIVKGVLLEINPAALETTDRIEGYRPDRDHCLYLREEVVVRFKDEQEAVAWTYFFANPSGIADCPRLVVGESDDISVFAWQSQSPFNCIRPFPTA